MEETPVILATLNLELHLRLAGALLIVLAGFNLLLPRRFAWPAELQRLTLLTRQVFWVHLFFIVLLLAMMGLLTLAFAPALLARTPLATVVLAGLSLFWIARLFVQFFVYSPALWRGNRLHTTFHVLFSVLWLYLSCVFGAAWLRSLH
jgi:hypothetical protein